MAQIGIFGGTFNPIHNGHLHLLQEAEKSLSLDRILVIPTNIPPHKRAEDLAPGADRLEMARLAVMEYKNVFVSDIELKAKGKSYTVLTLKKLKALFPEDTFTLLMGADMLLTFDKWYRWEEILTLAGLAAFARGDGEEQILLQKARTLPGARVVRVEPLPLSSTQVREIIRAGGDVSGMVPEEVFRYIVRRGLYQSPLSAFRKERDGRS